MRGIMMSSPPWSTPQRIEECSRSITLNGHNPGHCDPISPSRSKSIVASATPGNGMPRGVSASPLLSLVDHRYL
eukprot:5247717-Pyramimonas_sp.AAC.1